MQQNSSAGEAAASRAATKASAYGGSEVGAIIGGAVGTQILNLDQIFLRKNIPILIELAAFDSCTLNHLQYFAMLEH